MREKTMEALLELGISANTKGFVYITDAVMLIDEKEELRFQITKLYGEIAKLHADATAIRVERAIRHTFRKVCSYAPLKVTEKWLTATGKQTNGNLLSILYIRLKEAKQKEKIQ